MALAVAQGPEVAVNPASDINIADAPIVVKTLPVTTESIFINEVLSDAVPSDDLPSDASNDGVNASRPSDRWTFTAWSSPGMKGHNQTTKNTPGCYRLDGGAVGSFEGNPRASYTFYRDHRCERDRLSSNSAPVRSINPVIYPSSVKIHVNDHGHDKPDRHKYSLITWSKPGFSGKSERYRGMGCVNLDGRAFMSFQGGYNYKFHVGPNCQGRVILKSNGGMSSHKRISPRSAFISR
ncbi:hypothetical protein FBU30_010230 [Linnemannia zychae]|nr:hypothetical protein FBU30_010230 [Linnemannia zychae]